MSAGVWDGTYTEEQRAAAARHYAQLEAEAAAQQNDADSDDEATSMYSRRAPVHVDDHDADEEQAPVRQSVAAEPLIQQPAAAPAARRRPGYFRSFGARRKALGGGFTGFFKALFGRGYRTLERQQAAQREAAESEGGVLPEAGTQDAMSESGSPLMDMPGLAAVQGESSQPSFDRNAMLAGLDLDAIFDKPVQAPQPAPVREPKPAPVPREAPKKPDFFSRLNFGPARRNARRGSVAEASRNPIEERPARRASRVAPEYDTKRGGGEGAVEDAAYAAAQMGERVGLPASAIAYRTFHDRVPRSKAMKRVQDSYDWQFAQFARNRENEERERSYRDEGRLRNNVSDAKKRWGRGIGDSRLRRLVQLGVEEHDGEYHL